MPLRKFISMSSVSFSVFFGTIQRVKLTESDGFYVQSIDFARVSSRDFSVPDTLMDRAQKHTVH